MNCKIVKHLGVERKKTPDIGKSALITGASSGLGRELAILFSQNGHVILSGRNAKELENTRRQCKDPHNTTIICGELQSTAVITRLASSADLYGIQYLICCAGQYLKGSLLSYTSAEIQNVLSTNLVSTISLIHAVYPHLQPGAQIIHINSIAGKSTDSSELVYSASKHGMAAFLKGLRFEARERGVRVLDVFLGAVQTPMCANRPGYDKMMNVCETATAIYSAIIAANRTLQIEELHLGRFQIK